MPRCGSPLTIVALALSLCAAPVEATPKKSADPILERNAFDSSTGPLDRTDQGYTRFAGSICQDVDLRRVVLSEAPDWSFAELASGATTALVRVGSSFRGRRVVEIGGGRVWLENGAGSCEAYLHGSKKVSSPACVASHFKLGPPCIVQRTETSFEVAATMVDHALEVQAELMRSARIVPEQENGRVVGIRLFGVKPGSLMGALGFENGDRLERINGYDMTSPDHALEAYSRLRSASDLAVQVTRRGQRMVLTYLIR